MKVFISHARQDRQLVKKLGDELSRAGLDVWTDSQIYPGDNWAKMTGKALEESDAMVVVVTPNALESGPLKDDVQFALTSKNYGGRLIPVLVNMTTFAPGKEMPWILLKLNPVYLESASSDLHEVIARVRSLVETSPHAAG